MHQPLDAAHARRIHGTVHLVHVLPCSHTRMPGAVHPAVHALRPWVTSQPLAWSKCVVYGCRRCRCQPARPLPLCCTRPRRSKPPFPAACLLLKTLAHSICRKQQSQLTPQPVDVCPLAPGPAPCPSSRSAAQPAHLPQGPARRRQRRPGGGRVGPGAVDGAEGSGGRGSSAAGASAPPAGGGSAGGGGQEQPGGAGGGGLGLAGGRRGTAGKQSLRQGGGPVKGRGESGGLDMYGREGQAWAGGCCRNSLKVLAVLDAQAGAWLWLALWCCTPRPARASVVPLWSL